MSVERREPTLGGVGGLDEAADPGPAIISEAHGGTAPSPRPQPAAKSSGPGRGLAVFGLLIAIGAASASGFLYWQGEQQKLQAAVELEAAKDRIAKLEQKLDVNNEESSQSVAALGVQLKEANSEIRKLWGIAYDRNRKAISQHKSQIAGLGKKLKTATSDASKAAKTSAAQAATLSSLTSANEQSTASLEKAEQQLKGQAREMQKLLSQVQNQAEQVDQLRNGLLERVRQNEESIDSITVYRRTTNREILSMQKRLNAIQGGGKPAG